MALATVNRLTPKRWASLGSLSILSPTARFATSARSSSTSCR
jgi:hypothetical protein